MPSSKDDYRKLYQLQDKFLNWISPKELPFYLTGGTALGRFYLNHRYSDDLDFFTNADPCFQDHIKSLKASIVNYFDTDMEKSLFSEDFARFYIAFEHLSLKVEFVNDMPFRAGEPIHWSMGKIDTPLNILSNKLTAVTGRDEPKDVCDIIFIAMNYAFNWKAVFLDAKKKAVINEIDIEERLNTFPVDLLKSINWIEARSDISELKASLKSITDDFLYGKDNSLGRGKTHISAATICSDD